MSEILQREWEKINEIVSEINDIQDITVMRKKFLQEFKKLVYFDFADFDLIDLRNTKAVSLSNPVVVSRFSRNFEELFTLKYEKHFEKLDYTKWILSNLESIVYKESDIINNHARMKSSYYMDFLKPMNLINVAGMSLASNGACLGTVNLYRTEKKGDFTDRDIYILKQFIPHLKSKLLAQYKTESHSNSVYEKAVSVLEQKYNVSKREIEIIKLVCNDKNNKEISEALFISINTVKKHMGNILYKFQVKNRVQLINFLIRNNKEFFEEEMIMKSKD